MGTEPSGAGLRKDAPDADLLETLEPAVRDWWTDQFGDFLEENGGYFTPPQREAIPKIAAGENTLIASPTGSGKTLASFTAIINELFVREHEDGLENTVYCLYVSPLKSLANDIHRNLEVPLEGITEKLEDRGEDTQSLELRCTVPINLKPMAERTESLGNYFGIVFVPIPVGIKNLDERIAIVHERMDIRKAGIEAFLMYQLLNIAGRAPEPVQNLAMRIFEKQATGVVTNVPGPVGAAGDHAESASTSTSVPSIIAVANAGVSKAAGGPRATTGGATGRSPTTSFG